MATEEETPVQDSDIFHDFCCTLCEKQDRNVEAIKRCTDCCENVCESCLTQHNKFAAMRDHSLIDKQDAGKPQAKDGDRPDLPTVKCNSHPRNIIDIYCENHDDVGCSTCVAITHASCKMHDVPAMAAGIKATSAPGEVVDSLRTMGNTTAQLKYNREAHMKQVTTQRDAAVVSIEKKVDAIKKRLDDLKAAAIADVDVKFKELERAIQCDIDRLQDVISKLEKKEGQLKSVDNVGESDIFVYVKQARTEIRGRCDKVAREMEKPSGASLHVKIDETVLTCVTGLEKFVKVGRPVDLALSVAQTPTVRMDDDQSECSVTDCCILDNGTIVLTDEKNKCVKLFDKAYKALDRCSVKDIPTAVCGVGVGEVAMTLYDKKIVQFAAVDGKIHLTRSFSVGKQCRGLSYSNKRLFISCGGDWTEGAAHVRIYDKSGARLQTIKDDNLYVPLHNITTKDDDCIVANREKGILAIDNEETLAWQCQHADLKYATGLCVVDDWVLVCCNKTGNVLQVNLADQSSPRIILRGSTELKKPKSLTYDKRNDKLIISKSTGDMLLVYKINRK